MHSPIRIPSIHVPVYLIIYLCIYQPVDRARKGKTKEERKRKESGADAYPASELEEDAEGREDDGEDDVDAVGRARHGRGSSGERRAFSLDRWTEGKQ